jgi:hypothetical protein
MEMHRIYGHSFQCVFVRFCGNPTWDVLQNLAKIDWELLWSTIKAASALPCVPHRLTTWLTPLWTSKAASMHSTSSSVQTTLSPLTTCLASHGVYDNRTVAATLWSGQHCIILCPGPGERFAGPRDSLLLILGPLFSNYPAFIFIEIESHSHYKMISEY